MSPIVNKISTSVWHPVWSNINKQLGDGVLFRVEVNLLGPIRNQITQQVQEAVLMHHYVWVLQ